MGGFLSSGGMPNQLEQLLVNPKSVSVKECFRVLSPLMPLIHHHWDDGTTYEWRELKTEDHCNWAAQQCILIAIRVVRLRGQVARFYHCGPSRENHDSSVARVVYDPKLDPWRLLLVALLACSKVPLAWQHISYCAWRRRCSGKCRHGFQSCQRNRSLRNKMRETIQTWAVLTEFKYIDNASLMSGFEEFKSWAFPVNIASLPSSGKETPPVSLDPGIPATDVRPLPHLSTTEAHDQCISEFRLADVFSVA